MARKIDLGNATKKTQGRNTAGVREIGGPRRIRV